MVGPPLHRAALAAWGGVRLVTHRPWLGLAAFLAAWLLPASVQAERGIDALHLFVQGEGVFLDLGTRELLDERTRRTVESGLPGTCIFWVRIADGAGRIVREQILQHSLRFDLWEGHYVVEGMDAVSTYATLAAADSAWASPRALPLGPVDRFVRGAEYVLEVAIDVQPLAAADRERLGRYVSGAGGGTSEEVVFDLGALVSRVFGQADASVDGRTSAVLRFRPESLEVRP